MKVVVKKVTPIESIIEVQTRSGLEKLVISKTTYGHSYDGFDEWDMSDEEYYDLEELVDNVMKKMSGSSSLEISYD